MKAFFLLLSVGFNGICCKFCALFQAWSPFLLMFVVLQDFILSFWPRLYCIFPIIWKFLTFWAFFKKVSSSFATVHLPSFVAWLYLVMKVGGSTVTLRREPWNLEAITISLHLFNNEKSQLEKLCMCSLSLYIICFLKYLLHSTLFVRIFFHFLFIFPKKHFLAGHILVFITLSPSSLTCHIHKQNSSNFTACFIRRHLSDLNSWVN